MCGELAPKQCEGLFDPKGRIDNHYHSQAPDEYLSRDHFLTASESIRKALGRWTPIIRIHEDKTTCIIAYTIGKNPTMKDLGRAFGISLAWGYQTICSGNYIMLHTRAHDMMADIYTKGFQNKALFARLRMLINICSVTEFEEHFQLERQHLNPTPLNNDASDMLPCDIPDNLNTQYDIILMRATPRQR